MANRLVTERSTVLTALLPVTGQAINKMASVEISNYYSKYLRMNQVLVKERYCKGRIFKFCCSRFCVIQG